MLNMILTHKPTGINGKVDAECVTPDGKAMCRIAGHWFMAVDLEGARD